MRRFDSSGGRSVVLADRRGIAGDHRDVDQPALARGDAVERRA
jgi:hypothetical protein